MNFAVSVLNPLPDDVYIWHETLDTRRIVPRPNFILIGTYCCSLTKC